MEIAVLFFLTSGLFLGWALGANDAANVFGTAVGTRMIQFTTAAIICSVFVVIGAVVSGAGAAHTLGKLGSINTLSGSFMAALSAAIAVYTMTKVGIPVSTTQAIVGAILGWNFFSQTLTDTNSLIKILTTWVVCPLLSAVIAIVLFKFINWILHRYKFHLLRTDAYTRAGLILAGAFGSYSLGANNIGNVMGVFVSSSPFTDFSVGSMFTFNSTQQLFLLGALAIAVGVFTYSRKVMKTVGTGVIPLSPVAAWVVVVSHSLVLFLFASQQLEAFLASYDLPTIPLVPVSSSQAVVGAVLGIAILKGGRGIRWKVLGGIGLGWAVTPVIAGIVCFFGLFFLQNVFNQKVFEPITYSFSNQVITQLENKGIQSETVSGLYGKTFSSAFKLDNQLSEIKNLSDSNLELIYQTAENYPLYLSFSGLETLTESSLSNIQFNALLTLESRRYEHKWQLLNDLTEISKEWRYLPKNKINTAYNKKLSSNYDFVFRAFKAK